MNTQKEMLNLFLNIIIGMKRLEICLNFVRKTISCHYIPKMFNQNIVRSQQIVEYLSKTMLIQVHEAKDLIMRIGGSDEKLTIKDFQEHVGLIHTQTLDEGEQGIMRYLFEEVRIERSTDTIRMKIMKRWDFSTEQLFRSLSNSSPTVDVERFRKFFIKVRYPISDQEIQLLIGRIGNPVNLTMNFCEFQQAIKTQKQRVTGRIEQVPQMIMTKSQIKSPNNNYMQKLRRKYKYNNITTSQVFTNQNKCITPTRSLTPVRTTMKTEPKFVRNPTGFNQSTEPRKTIPTSKDFKELNSLLSLYLNQQRCLQNVLSQLDEVTELKQLSGYNDKEWVEVGVNTNSIPYNDFINVIFNYDTRQTPKKQLTVQQLSSNALNVADNLFQLLNDQQIQLQRTKLQFLKYSSIEILEPQFHKGYLDVLDFLQLLENATSSQVSLSDAELLIKKFNQFNSQRTVTRQTFLHQLT